MQPELHLRALEAHLFRLRARIVNLEIGMLTWAFGLAAVGTDAPKLYAFLCMAIVIGFMAYRLRSFDRIYRLWREVKHPLVVAKNVWKYFPVFNFGWLFLGLVATGVLTKQGIHGFPAF